tara:strand:+ start:815 stop:1930 length:1116 start_codon:yes stop_codon:yes gene_type:complete
MKNKKNIIFFLPNFSEGGAGKSILTICNSLSHERYNIIIICLGRCYYKNKFNKKTKVYELNINKTIFSFNLITKILKKNFNKENTIFISNMNYANVLSCIYIKLILNYKLLLIERTPLKELTTYYGINDYFKKKIIYFLMKILYRFSDLVILNSKYTLMKFKNEIKCKSISIYSPAIDVVKKNNMLKIKSFQKRDFLKILSIGRLSIEKRFDLLINSMKFLNKKKTKLNIIGNGPELLKLRQLIKKNKLQNIIKIKKFDKDYKKYFKKFDIFVSTSDFEGFPNIVVEALNSNKLVLSRDSGGGIHNILSNEKFGKIIDTENPKIIANEIVNLHKKYKKFYLNNKSLKRKLQNFTTEIIVAQFDKIFSNNKI